MKAVARFLRRLMTDRVLGERPTNQTTNINRPLITDFSETAGTSAAPATAQRYSVGPRSGVGATEWRPTTSITNTTITTKLPHMSRIQSRTFMTIVQLTQAAAAGGGGSVDQPPIRRKEWPEEDRFHCLAAETWLQLRQRELIDLNIGTKDEVNMGMLKDTRFIQLASIVANDKSPAAAPLTLSTDPNILPIQLPFTHIPTSDLFRPLTPEDHALVVKFISHDYANMIQSLRLKNGSEHARVPLIDRLMIASKACPFRLIVDPSTAEESEGRPSGWNARLWPDLYDVLDHAYGADLAGSETGRTPLLLREVELFHMVSNQLSSKLSATNEPAVRDELTDAIQRFHYLAQIGINEFMLLLPAVMHFLEHPWVCEQSERCKFILFYFQCLILSCQDLTRLKQLGPVIDQVTQLLFDEYFTDPKLVRSDSSFSRLAKLRGKYYQLIGDHAQAVQVYESISGDDFDSGYLEWSLDELPSDTFYELSNSYLHLNQCDLSRAYCSRGLKWLEGDTLAWRRRYQQHLSKTAGDPWWDRRREQLNQFHRIFHAMSFNHLKLIQKLCVESSTDT